MEFRLRLVPLLVFFFISFQLSAQSPYSKPLPFCDSCTHKNVRCLNDDITNSQQKNEAYRLRNEVMNRVILLASRSLSNDTITLSVVIHIVNDNPNSITNLEVENGIKDLNDAFSKAGNYAASLGVDTEIRFCIAQKDPDGGNTSGITRTTSFFSNNLNMNNEDSRLKDLVQWDPQQYINIWLITGIQAEAFADFTCGSWYRLRVGGYATLPPGGGATDGIVVTGFGKVLAHEMGHYLSLYHTFDGGCLNDNCETDGDRVCDTPPDNSVRPSSSCNNPQNSCFTDTASNYSNGAFPTNVPDPIFNFMDYGNNACSNEFTRGQSDRMRAAILTQRSGLLQDKCTSPCPENIVASFSRNIAYPLPGDVINFTNSSTGAANFEWWVDGALVSTAIDYAHTFNAIGKFKVMLKAFNNPGCFASSTDYVITTCGVTARFFGDKETIASMLNVYEDSVVFTNTSYQGQTFQWLIGNDQGMIEQVVSTNENLTYIFPAPANYTIRLVASNGTCTDTTGKYAVSVADPTADGAPFAVSLLCYQQNKVRVNFCLSDYGYAPLPMNTPINFYDADPSLPTANRLSPTFFLPYDVPGGNCYMCFSHTLNVNYSGIERIYMVFNDAGGSIPVVLPNATLPEKTYWNNFSNSFSNRTTIYASICQGENYAGHTQTGTYVDVIPSRFNGCDSTRTLFLTVRPVSRTTLNISICQGESYAGYNTSGTYTDVYTAANGCDSIRIINLVVKPKRTSSISVSICQGQNYAGYISSGIYIDTLTAANGCDSIRTLQLTVKPVSNTTVTHSICQGENYVGHTSSGTYVDVYTAINGCDSTRTLYLTVKPVFNTVVNKTICVGESYLGYSTTGTHVNVFTSMNGCDSTRTLNLTVKPTSFSTITKYICKGESYAGYDSSGTFVDVFAAANGCDSIRTLHLTVKPTFSVDIYKSICQGEQHAGYTTTGTFINVFTAANGCDSTRTLHLTVNPKKVTHINKPICKGESFFAGGQWQTTSGVYYDTAQTYLGCDSVLVTHLTVNPLPSPYLGSDKGLCVGDTILLNPGNFSSYMWQNAAVTPIFEATELGNYIVEVTNSFGCKARDTIAITSWFALPKDFLPPDSTLCRGNTLPIVLNGYVKYLWSTGSVGNGIRVYKSGQYFLEVTDRNGCIGTDSTKVEFIACINIQVPNAFTPNNDGLNDFFKPLIPAPVTNYTMQIFNKWGEMLFETKDYKRGWDGNFKGTQQSSAGYVYNITLTDIDGVKVRKYGSFVLIR